MRIGIDARFYGTLGKGLGRYTEKLIEHLEDVDQENEYIIFLRRENFSEYTPKSPRFKKVIAQYAWYGFAEQTVFVALLYRSRLDLVHFPHFNVPLLYYKKFVVTIHDLILVHYPTLRNTTRFSFLYWGKFFVYRWVITSAIHRAEHIITVSHFTQEDILSHYPQSLGKISVTYEAADTYCQFLAPKDEEQLFLRLGLYRPEMLGSDVSYRDIMQPYFLYVGNAYPHKNLSILFSVARAFPDSVLVLVGREDFFYTRLKDEARQAGIKNILFVGFLSDQELSAVYRSARVYIFPSLYEGFGLPPLEAMARGVPVVSSDRGSLPEILGDAPRYFDPTSPQSLLTALQVVVRDLVLQKEMRDRGYKQVARYSFRTMAEETARLYRDSFQNKKTLHGTSSSTTK
ncbi:MAG: glycosyltransferase family 4 protein [Candidatus Moranbacteria bacterium]|nr:glycosyltransferase family 4 protein [Candidatus Moranbacteria bacterium]